ncbi:Putative cargo-transport protein ypp1 [Cytospora mali]|uniref:Cargo-transport protein ypp1 n=1 Tax=Cytospora mali TaxID=578113 RepID=A0A194V5V8_CYTMA|nr:Putative cargo-transport protein ypp1 [Valsa mali var. pyri (nom. inval.)]
MAPTPNATKGRGYLDSLDNARCEGDWDAVPELVRKVRKHAPNRACLASTAEIEHGITKATASETPTAAGADTATAGNVPPKDIEVAAHLPKLLSLIEEEHTYAEDRFQAEVCVGWLHWAVGEYNLALDRLPEGFGENQVESLDNISEWTKVCMMKSAYLRANCLARSGKELDALAVFEASIPPTSFTWSSQTARKQLRYWSELFLTEYCMLHNDCREKGQVSLQDMNSLVCFRSWARWWDSSKGAPLAGGYGFKGSVPRRRIWWEYYKLLSTILQEDLPYPTSHVAITHTETSPRAQLLVELKRAETAFEALLLNETTFPKANEEREEVELFVATLMRNWTILTGRGWSEKDLGQGGKAGLSASVLEMLYRSAMKTYHSTAILRNLFIVHLAVAEFDLAFKAFDAYLDIAKKGRARVEKTGHEEKGLDDDATILKTISLCISALCRFGGRDAAEKAKDVASELEHWLEKIEPPQANGGMDSVQEEGGRSSATADRVPAKVLALAWQSIGLAHAQWARMTFDAAHRTEMQKKAIKSLHASLSTGLGGSADVRGVFALGLLLAEQRELTTAIELVKTALLARSARDETLVLSNGPFWRERSLIPLWHLLSLLLSARQEYVLAARTCECAIEQFGDPAVLYGQQTTYKSDHLNEAEKDLDASRGLVDEMDDFEKENILEVKMTQLAIVEITEGPRVAVNASLELLTLFSRLFGSVQVQPKQSLEPPKTSNVPRTSATFRGFKTGIFGNRNTRTDRRDNVAPEQPGEKLEATQTRPDTAHSISRAPTIQVTKENGTSNDTRRKSNHSEKRSESARRESGRRRDSQAARRRAASTGPVPHPATVIDGDAFYTPMVSDGLHASDFFSGADKGNPLSRPSSAVNPDGSARPHAADMSEIALDGMEPAGAVFPIIQFDKGYERRRRSAILVKVWLMIGGFYRRAGMYDDAKGAVNEAQKLVQTMEAEMGKDSGEMSKKLSAAPSLRDPGWAGKKSIEELWGDVWCENGRLQLVKGDIDAAREDFETALTHFPDHPAAIVGLSDILLDVYCEKVLPPPAFPGLDLVGGSEAMPGTEQSTADIMSRTRKDAGSDRLVSAEPIGLGAFKSSKEELHKASGVQKSSSSPHHDSHLIPPYKASSTPLVDRLASRDRAYGLLSNLTKLGTGWNYSEAWFTLARAHEESGQLDKAKDVLWWCVELEEGMGVREWDCVNTGGYVL